MKEAHAAYTQGGRVSNQKDGSYEHEDVKFVHAQGKRNGVRRPKRSVSRKEVTPTERNAAVSQAFGKHRTTEKGKRIVELAPATPERGRSESQAKKGSGAGARRESKGRKRKATVFDGEVGDDDNDGEVEGEAKVDSEQEKRGRLEILERGSAMPEPMDDVGRRE